MSSLQPTLKEARWVVWILMGWLVFIGIGHGVEPYLFSNVAELDDLDGIYEASATILALIGFGSTIGVKISTNEKQANTQLTGLILVFGCGAIVIIAQVFTMMGACCLGLSEKIYIGILMHTGASLLCMLMGYFVLVQRPQTEVGVDDKFSSEASRQTELDTTNDSAPPDPTNRDIQTGHDSKDSMPRRVPPNPSNPSG